MTELERIQNHERHLQRFSNVFESDEGVYVLRYILYELCGLHGAIKNDFDAGRHEVGARLWAEMIQAQPSVCNKIIAQLSMEYQLAREAAVSKARETDQQREDDND